LTTKFDGAALNLKTIFLCTITIEESYPAAGVERGVDGSVVERDELADVVDVGGGAVREHGAAPGEANMSPPSPRRAPCVARWRTRRCRGWPARGTGCGSPRAPARGTTAARRLTSGSGAPGRSAGHTGTGGSAPRPRRACTQSTWWGTRRARGGAVWPLPPSPQRCGAWRRMRRRSRLGPGRRMRRRW
jgi:hypothetical protein